MSMLTCAQEKSSIGQDNRISTVLKMSVDNIDPTPDLLLLI